MFRFLLSFFRRDVQCTADISPSRMAHAVRGRDGRYAYEWCNGARATQH